MDNNKYALRVQEVKDLKPAELLVYLADNNKIVYEDYFWLIIENVKYHTKQFPHYTAFWKGLNKDVDWTWLIELIEEEGWSDWHFYINAKEDKTILLPHAHIVRDIRHYLKTYFK